MSHSSVLRNDFYETPDGIRTRKLVAALYPELQSDYDRTYHAPLIRTLNQVVSDYNDYVLHTGEDITVLTDPDRLAVFMALMRTCAYSRHSRYNYIADLQLIELFKVQGLNEAVDLLSGHFGYHGLVAFVDLMYEFINMAGSAITSSVGAFQDSYDTFWNWQRTGCDMRVVGDGPFGGWYRALVLSNTAEDVDRLQAAMKESFFCYKNFGDHKTMRADGLIIREDVMDQILDLPMEVIVQNARLGDYLL
jgi:hypothetical protein